MVAHIFNPITEEAEVGESVNSRPARATKTNLDSKKQTDKYYLFKSTVRAAYLISYLIIEVHGCIKMRTLGLGI